MNKFSIHAILFTLFGGLLSCVTGPPITGPEPSHAVREAERVESAVRRNLEEAETEECVRVCEHLARLDGRSLTPEALQACEGKCRDHSTPERNRCLLNLERVSELDRCGY